MGTSKNITETMKNLAHYLKVECVCIPPNPFYIRWLNRFGGIDYWMFSKHQVYKRKQDSYTSYSPYISDFSAATGTEYNVNKTVSETVLIGAEMLSQTQWNELSRIAYSPLVQWYNEETKTWINVIVKDADNQYTSDKNRQIEYSLLLPQPQLQF